MDFLSGIFFPSNEMKSINTNNSDIVEAILTIEGMTCTGCEYSVNHAINTQAGIIESDVSYKSGKAIVKFDKTKISVEQLSKAIKKETGYAVINKKTKKQ